MLWIVTGGVGSGKSAFAERWAAAYGREAIRLACSAWPTANGPEDEAAGRPPGNAQSLKWMLLPADRSLAERLDRINLYSTNPLRSSSRVVIVDSLSGWLRREIEAVRAVFPPPAVILPPRRGRKPKPVETEEVFRQRTTMLEQSLGNVVRSLLDFEGRRVVVTEDPHAGLARDPWERWYVRELSAANRRLAEASDGMHVMTAGLATEVKGLRTKRGTNSDEDLYPHRR